jgi:hypothetical protein
MSDSTPERATGSQHIEERADPTAIAGLILGATAVAIQAADSPTVQGIVSKITGGDTATGKHEGNG